MSQTMDENAHERARRLGDKSRVEGLTAAEEAWLAAHVGECEGCAGRASAVDGAIRALWTPAVEVPAGLSAVTQLRVREAAAAWSERRLRKMALVAGCALSWLVGVASAPLVWRACAWLGAEFHLPRFVWILGFASWWFVPAACAAAMLLWGRERAERESA